MDKQPDRDSHSSRSRNQGSKKKTRGTATKKRAANVKLAPRPQPPFDEEESPIRIGVYSTQQQQQPQSNRRELERPNLDVLRSPAPSNPPDIAGWGGNAKKRPAAAVECEDSRISAGYSYVNASGENQPEGGSHLQAGNNEQHLPTHYVVDFTISDPDAPATPGVISAPVQSDRAPDPVSSVRPSLFPEEWEPDQTISDDVQEVLRFKSASYGVEEDPEPPETSTMLRQCHVKKLSYETLVGEVKDIYNALLTTEIRCLVECAKIEHITKLNETQWADLVECHKTLLHHHYNLLICTQHPISGREISAIPVTCKMPSRLLHQGIYIFLEIMKARRPDSHDYMTPFIYDAYGLIALLIETAPRFKNVWLECLGDLASYMMCLEERDSIENRAWKVVSSQWYHKALDENPGKGSLYHRLGNLSTPNMGRQLFFYSKSLVATEPYTMSKNRVESAFKMALDSIQNRGVTTPDLSSWFVGSHAMLIRSGSIHSFIVYVKEYIVIFAAQVKQQTFKFREAAICMGVPNIAAMLQYGEQDGILTRMFIDSQKLSSEVRLQNAIQYWLMLPKNPTQNTLDKDFPSDAATFSTPLKKLTYSTYLNFHTLSFVLKYTRNENIIPYVHLSLAFIWSLALVPDSMMYVEGEIPWTKITIFLNMLNRAFISESRLENVNFPIPTETKFRQLPEDFFFRSQIWSQTLYPSDFFAGATIDDDSRGRDVPSTKSARNERCLWYGYRLASCGRWIQLFEENGVKKFRPTDYANQLEETAMHPKVFSRPQRAVATSLPSSLPSSPPSKSRLTQPPRKGRGR
ncbi:hypothetical protein, variant [Blastomyces gilchristii SLH14081]|uniref:DNA/RNA-binding domain-containing protein n=1 Tax=Blastomyces gilchristii (strain SLH14081) TaxID=559298 RepID=A0A179UI83_BLAGS|nr:hypothetical protein, variant [Blastomyces gilchristii SLH14081]XP_031577911.1 uncharacterized protein BDBG_03741 [Blastomyces gilchristii SLH14081]OAT07703.1 hypothetical protein BDBG_03741 [Blastomyces gilchristii SLH14081]OAT07704.1 hypothetical protein, variant [Blastomyces gilchristii SLH14081]